MRALVTTAARRMELSTVAEPEPGVREVLLDVAATGICGSDYHLYLGDHPLTRHPMIQGHELCGVVRAHGPDCAGDHVVGAQVCVEPLLACGDCYPCRLGRYNCCTRLEIVGVHRPGGLQESIVVPERLLWAADGLDPAVAAFAEPISIALHGVTRASVAAGDSVLVLGAGPIGLATVLCAQLRGARVAIADLVEERLERARELGADMAVTAGDELAASVAAWTDGEGPTAVIEAAGSPAALRSAFELAPHAGRVVVVGISAQEVTLPMSAFTRKEITVFGARNSARIFPEAVELARKRRDAIERIVTQRIGLEQVPETIELALAHPERVAKAVVCA